MNKFKQKNKLKTSTIKTKILNRLSQISQMNHRTQIKFGHITVRLYFLVKVFINLENFLKN